MQNIQRRKDEDKNTRWCRVQTFLVAGIAGTICSAARHLYNTTQQQQQR